MDLKREILKQAQKRNFNKQRWNSPVSSYSSSLPSPPYSEENYDSSSDDANESVMSSHTSGTLKNFDSKLADYLIGNEQNQEHSKLGPQSQNRSFVNKVYPNLMKGVNGAVSDSVKTLTNKSKLWNSNSKRVKSRSKVSSQRNISKVNCNVCDNIVKGTLSSLKKHLIFGSVKCLDCNKIEKSCHTFRFEFDPKFSQQCPHHHLQWECNPVDNFRTWVNRNMNEASEDTFRNALKEYIHLLHPLRDCHPWSTAIKKCESYIKSHSKVIENDSNQSSATKKSKKEKDYQTETENIELPTSGHYLIVKEAIEACPDCYETIDIRDLKFNVEQCLIYTICRICGLHIYFVLDTPDGSASKIKILID